MINQGSREETYDVVVVGGGIAGTVAAIAAARLGCIVALVQDRPVLGGNSSNEVRVTISGAESLGNNRNARETGILEELRLEYAQRARTPRFNGEPRPLWDWLLWEWVIREPNITLYLNCRARRAVMWSADRIDAVIASQTTTEQDLTLKARLFIDCSGDGVVAASAGAEFRQGREACDEFGESRARDQADNYVLCPSLLFSAHDVGHPVRFNPPPWARSFPSDDDLPLRPHPTVEAGYWWIEYGGTLDPIRDAERIRDELVAVVLGVWDHLKNHGDHGAENHELDWIGSVLGKRESRRFLGDVILTQSDVEGQRLFPDRVAYGGWALDHLHPPEGIYSAEPPGNLPQRLYLMAEHGRWYPYGTIVKALYKDPPPHWPEIMPPLAGLFSIPFGALYSRNVRNLLFAGRHISATHVAFGSTRVQGTTAVMGQAVGTAAALCLKHNIDDSRTLRRDAIAELQQQLLKDDCYIIGLRSNDRKDALLGTTVRASSVAVLEMTEVESWLPLDVGRGQMVCFSEPRVEAVSLLLKSALQEEQEVRAELVRARRLDDFALDEVVATARATVAPEGSGWVGLDFAVELDPEWPYWVRVAPVDGVSWAYTSCEEIGSQRAEWYELLGRWQPVRGTHAFRIRPTSRPFAPGSVTNGYHRPEVAPNLWISDSSQPLPQWVELELAEPRWIDTIYLTFDTNLSDLVGVGAPAECVRDYRVLVGDGSSYVEVARVEGNYQRRRAHRFNALRASKVKLTVEATHGAREARVYEIRAYQERS